VTGCACVRGKEASESECFVLQRKEKNHRDSLWCDSMATTIALDALKPSKTDKSRHHGSTLAHSVVYGDI